MREESADELKRQAAKSLVRFVVIYGGIKIGTYLIIRRWAKSVFGSPEYISDRGK